MKEKVELIVLGHTKFREHSVVLHTLSQAYGRRGFLVRVGPKSAMTLFLPLNLVEAEVSPNPRSSLWHAGSFTLLDPLEGIRRNLYKNSMTLFMSEVLYRVVKEDTNEEGLSDWLKKQILTLNALESDFANFHLLFLLSFCGILGFAADPRGLAPFAGGQLRHIDALLTLPFEEALLYPLRGEDRSGIARAVLAYLEHHTESAIRIRSLDVLHDLFND